MSYYLWDAAKAESNRIKHGVRFEIAVRAFDDANALTVMDRVENGEQRWQTIGVIGEMVLLLVAHTEEEDGEDEIVRIISARKADRGERRRYEDYSGSRHRR